MERARPWLFACVGAICLVIGGFLAVMTRTEVSVYPGPNQQPPAPGTVTK